MDADRYARVREVFEGAWRLEPGLRGAFLDTECDGDAALRDEVEALLEASEAAQGSDNLLADTRIGRQREALERLHPAHPAGVPERIDRYRVTRHIATGGMGAVYEAEQDHPKRTVAIKMIDPRRSSPALVSRFKREAEILGRLKHPAIAQIHDAGTVDLGEGAQPYLVMEFVEGDPLTKHADDAKLDVRGRLKLLARVCDAVDYAHRQGVIHRDLKPDNILVDAEGRPKVLDFGIARATDDSTLVATQVTQDGQLLGTLAYMAPEQLDASGAEVTPATDVYALGVIAYELLAHRLPHDVAGHSLARAVRLLTDEDAARLSTHDTRLRGDVETIVSTALDKDVARRYPSAAALATDIRRHLADEPILARPASRIYRMRKFARRNRALVGGVTATLVTLVAGLVIAIVLSVREREQRLASDRLSYRTSVIAASSALHELRPNQARRFLDDAPEDLRGWEWHELSGRLEAGDRVVDTGRRIGRAWMSPDGTWFVSHDWDRRMSICDASTGQVRQEFSYTGRLTATGGLWIRNQGREIVVVGTEQGEHGEPIVWMEVRDPADGRRLGGWSRNDLIASLDDLDGSHVSLAQAQCLLLTGRRIIVLDVETGDPLRSVALDTVRQAGIPSVPSGQRAAVRTNGGVVILDSSLSIEATLPDAAATGALLKFSPDARRLAIAATDGPVHIWDLTSSPPVEIAVLPHEEMSQRMRFSPDGRTVITGGADRIVRIWDADDGSLRRALPGHGTRITAIMFTPDGRTVVTADASGEVRRWDFEGAAVRTLRGHASFVYSAAISPDGRRLITGGWDGFVGAVGSVRWWDLPTGAPVAAWGTETCLGAILSPDGETLAVLHDDAKDSYLDAWIDFLDPRDGQRRGLLRTAQVLSAAFDADGRRLAFVDRSKTARVIDVQRLEPIFETELGAPSPTLAHRVAWGPDDELLTTAEGGGTIEVRRGPEYAVERSWTAHASGICHLRFDRAGRRLVSAGSDGSVRVWDFATATELADLPDHGEPLCGAFSPDGTRLATGGRDKVVRIWETKTYTQVGELHGHERYVHDVAWSPDGTQLVSVSGDSTARIWETRPLAERRAAIEERERLVRELRPRVEKLFAELDDAGAVMMRLENDETLSGRAREVALQLAFGEAIARHPDGVRIETPAVE